MAFQCVLRRKECDGCMQCEGEAERREMANDLKEQEADRRYDAMKDEGRLRNY